MLKITVTFWAAETNPQVIKNLCAIVIVRRATGTLNTRWKDFSAQHLAQEAGLQNVIWETQADDTPGSLTLTLIALSDALPAVAVLLQDCDSVDEYEMYLGTDADGASPNDGNGGLYRTVDSQ